MKHTQSISQRLVAGSTFAAAGKIITALSALALNILLTRLLEPEDVGIYYLIVGVVTISGLAAQLGVHQAIVRALAGSLNTKNEELPRQSIKAAFLIVAVGIAIISFPYALGGGEWLGQAVFDSTVLGDMAVITALWACAYALQMLVSQIFRGFHQIGYATLFEGTSTGVFVVIGLVYVWIMYGHLELREVLFVILGSLFISVTLGLVLMRKFYAQTKQSSGMDITGMLRVSLPLFVSSTAVLGITELHILILGGASDEDAVAVYGAAYRLAKFVVVPLLIINSVIPPMIAQFVSQGKMHEAERVLRATATITAVPVIILLIAVVFGASAILTFLYGDFYGQGASVLIVLVAAQTINTLTGSPGVLLMMSNHQSVVMKLALVSGVLGIVTSFVLVGSLAAIGVALGVAVGLSSHNLGMWWYCKYKLGVNTRMGMESLKEVIVVMRRKIATKF